MLVWLSGFRTQNRSVVYWSYATFVRRLREAATPGGGECGPCHDFASNIMTFGLQLRKITEIFSQCNRMVLSCSALNAIRFSTWLSRAMASTGLLSPNMIGFRVRRRGQPSVSVSICRVAVLGGSQHQLTLSQSSRSGL